MQITIPHKLTEIQAITHIKKVLQQSRTQLAAHVTDMEERWEGNVMHFAFTAQKQHISGTLTIKNHAFDLYAKLPLMLRLFEGKIKKMIEEETKKMLG